MITSTMSMGQMFRFTISGTRDDGSPGTTDFWIDTTTTGAASRVANVFAAAAAGKTVFVWNYGQSESFGGQAAYLSAMENVNW
jgi:hypothetical protein